MTGVKLVTSGITGVTPGVTGNNQEYKYCAFFPSELSQPLSWWQYLFCGFLWYRLP